MQVNVLMLYRNWKLSNDDLGKAMQQSVSYNKEIHQSQSAIKNDLQDLKQRQADLRSILSSSIDAQEKVLTGQEHLMQQQLKMHSQTKYALESLEDQSSKMEKQMARQAVTQEILINKQHEAFQQIQSFQVSLTLSNTCLEITTRSN